MTTVDFGDLHGLEDLVQSLLIVLSQQEPMLKAVGVKLLYQLMMILHEVSAHGKWDAESHHISGRAKLWQSLLNLLHYCIIKELIFKFYFLAVRQCRHQELRTWVFICDQLLDSLSIVFYFFLEYSEHLFFSLAATDSFALE